jgi:hypothetical protein
VDAGPERLIDTNGGDDINAHVTGRFLRVFYCPLGRDERRRAV